MTSKSLILGLCATTVAATGAIAAFASNFIQTSYYIKPSTGNTIYNVTGKFAGCNGTTNICRVRAVSPTGAVITETATVYTDAAASQKAQSVFVNAGTVTIP